MADDLKNSALPRAISHVVADVVDLLQKEMRLARAELSEKLTIKLHAAGWMGATAFFGIIAALLVVEGLVFGIASFGLAIHWSCLIVAAVLAAAAGIAFAMGKADAGESVAPSRTIHHVKQDLATAKEQLT